MKGYVTDIESKTLKNENFREVLYTADRMQLVVMSVPDEIGKEVHGQDQFIRIEKGEGKAVLDGVENDLKDGSVVIIPAGTKHNIVNTGNEPLKLYTLYAPPHHKDGVVHKTKEEADKDKEEFLGDTTE
ncbi:MAG: hypothetical protein QOE22_742 [Candidatus Parcubacteria bacterium]|jgi:mannose-6-phosphate isomerase-like protein (cupin superfamily)|nr:hypothetical protein [Candidatus Parcubacteria bacterium]